MWLILLYVSFNTSVTHFIVISTQNLIKDGERLTASIQIKLDIKNCLKGGFQARSYRAKEGKHIPMTTTSLVFFTKMRCCDAVELSLLRVRLQQANCKLQQKNLFYQSMFILQYRLSVVV